MANDNQRINAKKAKEIADNTVENKDKERLNELFNRIYRVAGQGAYILNIYHKEEPFTFSVAVENKDILSEKGFGVRVYGEQKDTHKPYVEIRWDKDE